MNSPQSPLSGFYRGLTIAFILILASLLYAFYWNQVGKAAIGRIGDWAAARRAEGFSVSYDKIDVSGFPGRLAFDIGLPQIDSPVSAGGGMWGASAIVARISPFGIGPVFIEAKGDQEFRLPPALGSATGTLISRKFNAEVVFGFRGFPERLSIVVDDARIEGSTPMGIGHLVATTNWLEVAKIDEKAPTIIVSLDGKYIDLPPALDLPLGPRIGAINLKASVLGEIPTGKIVPALSSWRDAGGTLSVDTLDFRWDPLSLSGSGIVALDDQLQPIAALSTTISGFFEAVDGLSRSGIVSPRDASMAKVVLGMMAKPQPGGGKPAVSLPLTIQDRILFAGPVRLAKVKDIHWSAEHVVAPARPLGSPP